MIQRLPDRYTRGNDALNGGKFYHVRIDDKTQPKAMYKVFYKQAHAKKKKLSSYEVFRIKVQKAVDMKVGNTIVHYDEKEMKPNDEAFGKWAWQCFNIDDARKIFASL
jgi:hypothetical protein